MHRRTFLRTGLAGGAAAGLASLTGCSDRAPATGADDAPPPAPGSGPGSPTPAPFELEEVSIGDLQDRMARGEESARSIVERYLERIEALDRDPSGPALNQILELNPEALALALERDAERARGERRGPLHGIPVLLKDNIGTADRMTTTAGSLALSGSRPATDAFLVSRLREAGAILLGKTNLSEWANFRSTQSTSGWSGRGGQGRNPYALDRQASGSSSGSAAAVAANFAAVAVGTETDGSIVSPASHCSLVGIKPTLGLISRTGIIPIAHSQDTAGPMARTVTDAVVLLGAMAGADPDDAATEAFAARGQRDYTASLTPNGLEGTRLGIVREALFGRSPFADAIAEEAIEAMRAGGATIVDPVQVPTLAGIADPELEVLLYEFRADLDAYLASLGPEAPVKSLADVIAFNEGNRDREMSYFGQEIFHMAQAKGSLDSEPYRQALATCRRLSRTEGIDAVMDEHRLDALVAPTGSPPSPIDLVNGDHYLGGSSTLAAVAGYPHITVPAGYAFGLPVGVSFFGRAWSEPDLIRIAFAFEQATLARRPPRFLPTADLAA